MLEKGGTPMIYGNVTGRHIERRPGWHCQRARRVLSPSDSRRRPFLQQREHILSPPPPRCVWKYQTAFVYDRSILDRVHDRQCICLLEDRAIPREASHRFSIYGLVNTAEKCRLPAKILPKRHAAFAAWQIYYVRTRAQVRAVR